MSFAITPKAKGDEEKMATGLRRLSEEDPTLQMRRDPQTGEQLLSGLSQMQVEVAVDRLRSRFHVDVELHPPRVPYKETIRKEVARAPPLQEADRRPRPVRRLRDPCSSRSSAATASSATSSSTRSSAASSRRATGRPSTRACARRWSTATSPARRSTGVRVTLIDGMEHAVDSSEMAFKIAGSIAFKEAYQKADPVLLEPIMELEVTVPDDAVGAVNGDLNSRRGRLQGMEPRGGMTTIKAEVPMAEVLTYSQALTSMTGGRGDYTMSFLRYEEVPTHVAQKIIEQTKKEREEAKA